MTRIFLISLKLIMIDSKFFFLLVGSRFFATITLYFIFYSRPAIPINQFHFWIYTQYSPIFLRKKIPTSELLTKITQTEFFFMWKKFSLDSFVFFIYDLILTETYKILQKSAIFLEQEKRVICYYTSNGKVIRLKPHKLEVNTCYVPFHHRFLIYGT